MSLLLLPHPYIYRTAVENGWSTPRAVPLLAYATGSCMWRHYRVPRSELVTVVVSIGTAVQYCVVSCVSRRRMRCLNACGVEPLVVVVVVVFSEDGVRDLHLGRTYYHFERSMRLYTSHSSRPCSVWSYEQQDAIFSPSRTPSSNE